MTKFGHKLETYATKPKYNVSLETEPYLKHIIASFDVIVTVVYVLYMVLFLCKV